MNPLIINGLIIWSYHNICINIDSSDKLTGCTLNVIHIHFIVWHQHSSNMIAFGYIISTTGDQFAHQDIGYKLQHDHKTIQLTRSNKKKISQRILMRITEKHCTLSVYSSIRMVIVDCSNNNRSYVFI